MAADADTIPRLDAIEGWPTPEERGDWFGSPLPEAAMLEAYRADRMHHAWLLGGPKGIGKATLAYRFARFMLAHPDPRAKAVASVNDLAIAPDDPAFRKVARRAHPNLLVLERPWDTDRKRYRTELTVSEIRRTVSFFGSTAGEGGWRVAIVDAADDMNPSAANALLKVLEEPPARSLFLIVAHAPGRVMPTIRSRCRRLDIAPLPSEAIVNALKSAPTGSEAPPEDVATAALLSEGSLRRAILLLEQGAAEIARGFFRLAATLPDLDVQTLHVFADRVSGRGADDAHETFIDILRGWLDRRVRGESEPEEGRKGAAALSRVPLARWAEVWEKVNESAAQADELNLDRKQLVLSIFMTLARATRM